MRRRICVFAVALWLAALAVTATAAAVAERPRLFVVLVLDQFRHEYFARHQASFGAGGFKLLLDRGAVFANCHYPYAATLTAPGHTTIATGAYPMATGIIGNDWFDRVAGRFTTAERDESYNLLGTEPAAPGASPKWLIGSALGDELRLASGGRARVISISGKPWSAILAGGKSANAAYWFDPRTLRAVSSSYYMKELPPWVQQFNAQNWADKYAGKTWAQVDRPAAEPYLTFPAAGSERAKLARVVTDSPFFTDVQLAFARAAVENEKLGSGPATDMLVVSISALDFVGHDWGPDSPRTRDTILRADRSVAEFLRFLDTRIGLNNVWIALTADHGVAPMAEAAQELRIDAGRVASKDLVAKVETTLAAAYGGETGETWVQSATPPHLYLDPAPIRKRRLNVADVARRAADAAMGLGGFSAVFTRSDLAGCSPGLDLLGKVCASYHQARGGDLYLVLKPFWIFELRDKPKATSHGTPYTYDTHVPLIFAGAPFKAGTYFEPASPADLAVTVAAALGISAPATASGRVLHEALDKSPIPANVRPQR